MRAYLAFAAKEFIEGIRTYKLIALIVVFLIFGIMNPLAAKLLPELVDVLAGGEFILALAEPKAIDSWMQFFKNISQIGLIATIILFSGIMAQEVSKGTLINMITKGLSRTTVILAKFTYLALAWTIAYTACALVTLGYTVYLFPGSGVDNLIFSLLALWLFGMLLISVLLLAASATKSSYACLLAVGLFVVILMLLSIIPSTHDYNPLSLTTESTALMVGALNPDTLFPAIGISVVAAMAFVVLAMIVFRKRSLL